MRRRWPEFLARRWRWLGAGAALLAAPKCLVCIAAYVGLAGALGLAGPELCGAPARTGSGTTLLLVAAAVSVSVLLVRRRRRRLARRRPA